MTEDPTAKAFDQIIATVSPDVLKDYPPQPVPTSPVLPSVDTSSNTGDLRMAAATKMKPENVIQNGFLNDLGKDYVAVDDKGHDIARSDDETIRRSYPNANLFTGSDFRKSVTSPAEKGIENPVLVNPPPGDQLGTWGDTTNTNLGTLTHVLDDGTPYEGPAALEPNDPSLNKIAGAKGEPIKDALKVAHDASTEAENSGRHAKTDELQAAQVDALEEDGAFDHDGDGRSGGSKKGADSTASKGKAKKTAAKK